MPTRRKNPVPYSVPAAVEAPGGALSCSRRTIRAEAERTQRDFDDALLTEGALAAAREAVASLLTSHRRSHATDAESVPIPPKIPPSSVAPPGKGEFPGTNSESGCVNPPEAQNGL
jgi:hypothetical protein